MKPSTSSFISQGNTGSVYWVTGLPGAGKSTFARALNTCLREAGKPSLLLDSDDIRIAFGDMLGFDRESRRQLGAAYGRLANLFSKQGFDLVFATTSLFEDIRRWNRENLKHYQEIYIKTPTDLIVQRHPRGLYARALDKRIRNVPGVDQYIEEPRNPDFVITNDASMPSERLRELARDILEARAPASSISPERNTMLGAG